MPEFQVPLGAVPIRLDQFLSDKIIDRARNQIQRDIVAGLVQVNDDNVLQPGLKLRPGWRINYDPPVTDVVELQPENIPLTIIFEDEHLLVIEKPVGLVVHPAPGHNGGTLANALLCYCGPTLEGVGGEGRWGVVHRLDALTSGLMLAAKTRLAYDRLVAMLAAREVHRLYVGLAMGNFEQSRGTIDLPIRRRHGDRTRMGVLEPRRAASLHIVGKSARTDWEVLIQAKGIALLGLNLHSGRTHQIRVHLQAIGRPIMSDPVYGWTKSRTLHMLPSSMRPPLAKAWPARQLLHAARLLLQHPCEARKLEFTSLPPHDFQQVLEIFWPPELSGESMHTWLQQPLSK